LVDLPFADKSQWLSLRNACRLLDVSDVTLRQWADFGYVPVYRTPGGHRRFLRHDLESLVNGQHQADHGRDDAAEGSALRRIRRRLTRNSVAQQPWYQSIEEEGRVRMRLFGRRLLSLLLQETGPKRRRQESLEEARILGREYGAEMREREVTVTETVEAFLFFRTMVLDSTNPGTWPRIMEAADRMLIGVVESYENPAGARPAPPAVIPRRSNNE
jgi:excisionase family DNA binding protein